MATVKKTRIGLPLWSVFKTLPFQCRGHGFDPWMGKFHMLLGMAKNK